MRVEKHTIGQLARILDVDERQLSSTAQRVLGLSATRLSDPAFRLPANDCLQLAQALGKSDEWASMSEALARASLKPARRPELKRDPCAKNELAFGNLPHGLWVHPDVSDGLSGLTQLCQRLGIVLQHLAAHGRTSVVKGCRNAANRGWRRSPLGGNGGMQYYLWWTVQGSGPTRGIAFPDRDGVLVRAVRHHDDHGPLDAGVLNDYLPFIAARDRGRRPRRSALDARPDRVHTARRPGASRARSARIREDDRAVEGG